jgi:hypothetical protein
LICDRVIRAFGSTWIIWRNKSLTSKLKYRGQWKSPWTILL